MDWKNPDLSIISKKVQATNQQFWLLLGDEYDAWPEDGFRNKMAFCSLEVWALCCDKHQAVYLNQSVLF